MGMAPSNKNFAFRVKKNEYASLVLLRAFVALGVVRAVPLIDPLRRCWLRAGRR